MDVGYRGGIVCLLVILGFIVRCVASDGQVCRVEERLNMGLSKIQDPATILSVAYDYHSAPDCYNACCNYTGNQCNAVSYYDKELLCMLLSCHPFGNCVWVTVEGFTAARVQLATVTDDAMPTPPPSLISSQVTSSSTSQQPTTLPQGLAEGVQPTTTTTTQATPQTTPSPSTTGLEQIVTQPLNAPQDSIQELPHPYGANSSEVFDWNVDNGGEIHSVETVPVGNNPSVNPESSEHVTTAAIQGDYSIYNLTNDESVSNQMVANETLVSANNDSSVSEEDWNVDGSVFLMSDDDRNKSGQTSETGSTKGVTYDPTGNSDGPGSTEEPWNIDSFLSNNDEHADDAQPTDLNNGQTGTGQLTDLNNGHTDSGQSNLIDGQTDNGNPTDKAQSTDLSNGQIGSGQPTDLNKGQANRTIGQPIDLDYGEAGTGQFNDYNNNDTEPNYDDPWIMDQWLLSPLDDTNNNGQATDSANNGPNNNEQTDNGQKDNGQKDNGHTDNGQADNGRMDNVQADNVKDDFGFTDDGWPQPNTNNELSPNSNAGDNGQPDDQQQDRPFDEVNGPPSIDDWQAPTNSDVPDQSNPEGESSFEEPVFVPEERPRDRHRMLIQSPGIIIGLCSALGVAFLVLLAVCRKVYMSHDRPRYKPLRDYDIRFEPPAASSALLP